jgi:hypothetical protein
MLPVVAERIGRVPLALEVQASEALAVLLQLALQPQARLTLVLAVVERTVLLEQQVVLEL